MRILHIMAGDKVGGAETFFLDGIKALHERGITQSVITRDNNDHKINTLKQLGIPYQTASFNRLLKYTTTVKIKKAITDFKPSIIHHWMGRAGEFSQPENGFTNLGWYGGYYKPTRFRHCSHHAGVTHDIRDHIIQNGVKPLNAHTLHIYAEFSEGQKLNRAEFDTPADAPLLLALARLHNKKGLDTLLKAMQDVPEAYLWIAGDGPEEANLKALCKALNLEQRVRFLGWRNDRENLLATADIIAFPSRYEPFGAVVIEAWWAGKPLVTAKAAGPKAYVQNRENGLIVEIDDVPALADALRTAITDQTLCARMIANGKKAYQDGFSKSVFQKNVMALYEAIKPQDSEN